jgi:hypothetical protein
MFENCEYTIDLLGASGERISATVEMSVWDRDTSSGQQRDCTLSIQWPGGKVEAVDFSVYHAFALAREKLQPHGLLPYCFGACPDVQVSGMVVEMGDGTMAYRLSDPQDGWGGPTVNIFDSAPDIVPAPVAEQRQFHSRRRSRLDSQTRETST